MQTLIERARERVLETKEWSPICARAIARGDWDMGALVRDALVQLETEDAVLLQEAA